MLVENDAFHGMMESLWKTTLLDLMRVSGRDRILARGAVCSRRHQAFLTEHFRHIRELTLLDPFRLGILLDRLDEVQAVPGDVVEFGSYQGGSGLLMALLLRSMGSSKVVHLFDSFAGLPPPDARWDRGYCEGQLRSDLDALRVRISTLGLTNVVVHPGWFRDTVPPFLATQPSIAFLHVDCDLYDSTRDSLGLACEYVAPLAWVVLDDFNDGGRGEKQAALERLQGEPPVFHVGPAPQVYYRKGESRSEAGSPVVSDGGFHYSFRDILRNTPYLDWLREVHGLDLPAMLRPYS